MIANVAALFVRPDGPYPSLVSEWYDENRDARTYAGPHPIVAHPPCARWGSRWYTDGSEKPGLDGGLFEFALIALCKWGGVLEHPRGSYAWKKYALPTPKSDSWQRVIHASLLWQTEVRQQSYGCLCEKKTWLLYCGRSAPPLLDWSDPGPPEYAFSAPDDPTRSRALRSGDLPKKFRSLTPLPFAKLLISIAEAA